MVTDLIQIRRLGENRREENQSLRRFLRTHGYAERRLRRVAEAIEEEIDCTACASCCKQATVKLHDRDVERLSRFLRITQRAFLAEYTTISGEGTILKRTGAGCVFLDGNLCSIYEARPSNCSDFPHLVRGAGSLPSRMWEMVDRACYCPIVYNTLEAFKDEVGFRKK
jgi:Fe-S-cluster containining protein